MRQFICLAIILAALIAAAPGANASSIENARRLTVAMGLQNEIDKAIGSAVASIRSQMTQQGVAPEKVDAFVAALRDELDAGAATLVDDLARSYAGRFSDAEVEDLIAFYESPTGKKLVAVQTELAQEQAQAILRWIAGALEKAATAVSNSGASV